MLRTRTQHRKVKRKAASRRKQKAPPPPGKLPGALCHECPFKEGKLIEPSWVNGSLVEMRDGQLVALQRARPKPARLAVVMERPTKFEAAEHVPIGGATARQLLHSLKPELYPEEIHQTNAICCLLPPNVKQDRDWKKKINKARKCCAGRLVTELDECGAPVVMACGPTALHSAAQLSRRPNIFDWRGLIIELNRENGAKRIVIGSLHPYFVYQAPLWRDVWEIDTDRIQRIVADGWHPPEKNPDHKRIPDPKTIPQLRKALAQMGPEMSMDVETVGVKPLLARLTCIGMSDGERSLVIPWSTGPDGMVPHFGRRQAEAAKIVAAAFRKRRLITHNGPGFDQPVLKQHGIELLPRRDDGDTWEDTMIGHHAFAGHMRRSLGFVVSLYLDAPAWKQSHGARAAKGTGAKKDLSPTAARAVAHADFEEIKAYNARDCLYTKIAWDRMQSDLDRDRGVYDQDKKSAILCRTMSANGFAFDRNEAKRARLVCIEEERRIRRRMRRVSGIRFNPGSPKQLQKLFFKTLGAPILKVNESTGDPSLDINVMRAFAASAHPEISELATLVIDYRKVQKMRSTYIDGIEVELDGRVHPQWQSCGAVSGRYSCQRPSLMNLAKGERVGVAIRGLYVAEPGKLLVSFDFGQLEMRVAAYTTGDETMIAACEGSDLHAANAAILFPQFLDLEEGSKEYKQLRNIAKTAGFAVCYGAGVDTVYARIVANGIPITRVQVEAMLDRLKRAFWRYYTWQDRSYELTMKRGYVESPILHRKRWLGHSPVRTENSNFPIQSGAADLMNLTLWELFTKLRRDKRVKLVAQVHDQAIFEVDKACAESVRDLCIEVAQQERVVNGRKVRFPIDPKIADRWSLL